MKRPCILDERTIIGPLLNQVKEMATPNNNYNENIRDQLYIFIHIYFKHRFRSPPSHQNDSKLSPQKKNPYPLPSLLTPKSNGMIACLPAKKKRKGTRNRRRKRR